MQGDVFLVTFCVVAGIIFGLRINSTSTLHSIRMFGYSAEWGQKRVVGHIECKVGDHWVKEKE